MKKYLWLTFIPVILFMTGLSQASYRIELESGKSVITRYYWEEDGWVMFYQYDGVVGYPAHLVRDIRESDRPPSYETVKERIKEADEEELDPTLTDVDLIEEADEAETDMDPEEFESKVEQYQEELKTIRQKIAKQVDIYNSAKNNETVLYETREKIESLQIAQSNLRQEVLSLYNDYLPHWWHNIIQTIQ